ncbi:MAG: hypothetical protein LC795_08405 [Acidobacteria bacterium]|nr:hypothetical protein [Acidobacteriota bacterium]
MRRTLSTLLPILLAFQATAVRAQDAAKFVQPSGQAQHQQPRPAAQATRPLTNADVREMVEAKIAPEVVVEKIKASPCDFDTSPGALGRLKEAGVPDALLLVMVMSPKCAPQPQPAPPPRRVAVSVPAGTVVELETAYTINSQLTRKGDAISFRVVNPVVVDGQIVVEKGATATALVTKAERGGHFGRAGRIAWMMKEVTAADGSRIPLQFNGRMVGDSKGAKVATSMVVMGTLMWPIAPVVLFHGFKRGGNAFVPEGKRYDAAVFAPATVHVTARD